MNRLKYPYLVLSVVLALSVALAAPITALSAEPVVAEPVQASEEVSADAVVPFRQMIYKLLYVDGHQIGSTEGIWAGLLSGELPEDTPLPARIEVALPAGTHVGWFGQRPDLANQDHAIQFPEPYEMRTEGEFDIYTAVMTDFHTMQLEFRFDGEPAEREGNEMSLDLSYAPIQDLEELHLTAAFPSGFVARDTTLNFMGAGPNDEQAYSRIFTQVNAEQLYETTIVGTFTGTDAVDSEASTTTILIIVGIAAVLIVAVFLFFVRGMRNKES